LFKLYENKYILSASISLDTKGFKSVSTKGFTPKAFKLSVDAPVFVILILASNNNPSVNAVTEGKARI